MSAVDTKKITMPYGVDSYVAWIAKEGVRVHEGISANLLRVETEDWPRWGIKGAAMHFKGRGDYCSQFLFDVSAGRSSNPVHHLFEALYFVLEGRGSTQLEFPDGRKKQFEWGPRSFFAIPLNATYRHFNASGKDRALLVATTTAPLVMKTFHNDDFVFNTPYQFSERIGKDEYYTGDGDLHLIKAGHNTWQTNFVPDLGTIELTAYDERGAGSQNIKFAMADSIMHAHISEVAPATYKKGHKHGAGAHVMTLTGGGYSLLWYPGDKDFERVEWEYGTVFPPCNQQFHQHFVTSEQPSRYLATIIGGMSYVFTEQQARTSGYGDAKSASYTSLKEGGDQIEYADQDPRIHEIWLEEMRKRGITPRLELPVRR
jgi:mannose-6-phosphate isomerase-like protein (cupin superfamily)